jgi:hypothetical protein
MACFGHSSDDDLPPHGESDEFGIRLEAESTHGAIFVKGYGPGRNGQGVGDFSHRFPFGQESDDFSLTWCQRFAPGFASQRLHVGDYRRRANSELLSDVTGGVAAPKGLGRGGLDNVKAEGVREPPRCLACIVQLFLVAAPKPQSRHEGYQTVLVCPKLVGAQVRCGTATIIHAPIPKVMNGIEHVRRAAFAGQTNSFVRYCCAAGAYARAC